MGNPGPDFNPAQRPGDNLYTDSVVALDADTGKLRWHFQFTPNDRYDWDSTQVPVLVDATVAGRARQTADARESQRVLLRARSATGKFLLGKPFIKVNWASGLDERRPADRDAAAARRADFSRAAGRHELVLALIQPADRSLLHSAWEDVSGVFTSEAAEYRPGRTFMGGDYRATRPAPDAAVAPNIRRGPINTWTDAAGHGAVVAIDPATGERKWTFPMYDLTDAGILTTASDLLFTGGREGYFQALDARTGALLWKSSLGSVQIYSAPDHVQVDGKQFVTIICGNVLARMRRRD